MYEVLGVVEQEKMCTSRVVVANQVSAIGSPGSPTEARYIEYIPEP